MLKYNVTISRIIGSGVIVYEILYFNITSTKTIKIELDGSHKKQQKKGI